jgi:hypothetical protein
MTDFLDLINYEKRINSMSLGELMAEGNRLIACSQALDNKEKSKRLACQTRSKSIPKNATIRKEYVKCKKTNCYHKKHGPYYYAYWKDPVSKRLRKKYIGRHFEKDTISADMVHTGTSVPVERQSILDRQVKKRKKKLLVVA